MTLNQKDKDEFLNTAIYAAKEASKVILRSNQKTVKTYKAKTDLVTSTDHESERVIIDIIRSKHPDHSILAEESGNFKRHLDYSWIIIHLMEQRILSTVILYLVFQSLCRTKIKS